MKKPINKMSVTTSLFWAAAIIAAAIVHAPWFYTIVLLPVLAFSSMASIETIGRQRGCAG
ncbi:MAG TPA: hypothetical protein VKH15_00740 [Candidatus Acidoferrum sp.]|nr:hypothetical protein [Candidatus Acidoferrum sp.]